MAQKVLIIDQDKDIAELLESSFKTEGFQAIAITTSAEAIKNFKQTKPDILVLDVLLPKQGALKILKTISDSGFGESLPVIAIGDKRGDGITTLEVLEKEFSVTNFIKKPFRIPQLLKNAVDMLQGFTEDTASTDRIQQRAPASRSETVSSPEVATRVKPDRPTSASDDFIDLIEPDQKEESSPESSPAQMMEMETMEMEAVSEEQFTKTEQIPAKPKSDKRHIVVVDDEVMILNLLKKILQEVGFQVTTANKATLALKIVTQTQPDLVISDIMMPQLDGYSLCRMIKSKKELAQTKVMLLTAKNLKQDKGKGFKSGADFFMQKPINRVKLLSVVKNLLNL
ncbi:response regulator [candidate division CSSED10-310 bacterium]|uniref:Response regulator n=1 Tax=candidate division CSSED10-310 bacterium TaxID=2855610 RepID=A0ABV6YU04_UNCC1